MTRHFYAGRVLTPALILFLLAASGCRDFGVNDPTAEEEPGSKQFEIGFDTEFEMAVGDIVSLAGTGLDIEFTLITEDSRCPANVQCIQPGKAGILLTVTDEHQQRTQLILLIPGLVATPYRLNSIIQHKGQRFKLLQLNPYPVDGVQSQEKDFRALIIVES